MGTQSQSTEKNLFKRVMELTLALNLTLTLSSLLLPMSSKAQETLPPPIELPEGIYRFAGELNPKLLRVNKSFDHRVKEQELEIKELKKKGYFCFRRSQAETRCEIKYSQFPIPQGAAARIGEELKPYPVNFAQASGIDFSHNGSTTKEWLVYGDFNIGPQRITVYRLSKSHEGAISVAFPADNGTPISFLNYYENKKYGLSLILQRKDTEGWAYNYHFDALYTPESSDGDFFRR